MDPHSLAVYVFFMLLGCNIISASQPKWNYPKEQTNTYEKAPRVPLNVLPMRSYKAVPGRVSNSTRPCPCTEKKLCQPVTKIHPTEVYAFSTRNDDRYWQHYDWSKVTTVAQFGYISDELMCFAHHRGVRVVIKGDYPKSKLTNATLRHEWVTSMVNTMTYRFLDGINVDFEEPIAANETAERAGLTLLIKELSTTVKAKWPSAQITFDIPYSPNCTYGRCFDYKGLTGILDFAVIMAYDLEIEKKYAYSRNAYGETYQGLKQYLNSGIPADKLVLALPWYGFSFNCRTYNKTNDLCTVRSSTTLPYDAIMETYLPVSFTGRRWCSDAKAPYLSVKDGITDAIYQVWYDDPQSLAYKYRLARALGLKGVGMWTADCLNYGDIVQTIDMWRPI